MKKRGRLAELGLSLGEEEKKERERTTEGRKRLKIRRLRKRVDRRE